MTTEAKAGQLVITSLAVTGALALAGQTVTGHLSPLRVALGVGVAGIALSTLAELNPDLAAGLALLILTTSVFVFGGPVWDSLAGQLGKGPTTTVPTLSPTKP